MQAIVLMGATYIKNGGIFEMFQAEGTLSLYLTGVVMQSRIQQVHSSS